MLIRHQAINQTITILFILRSGLVFFCVNCKVSTFGLSKIQQKSRLLHEKNLWMEFIDIANCVSKTDCKNEHFLGY